MNTIKLNEVNINTISLPTIDLNFPKPEIDYSQFPENLLLDSTKTTTLTTLTYILSKPIDDNINITLSLWSNSYLPAGRLTILIYNYTTKTQTYTFKSLTAKPFNTIQMTTNNKNTNLGTDVYGKSYIQLSFQTRNPTVNKAKLELGWNDNPVWSPALEEI